MKKVLFFCCILFIAILPIFSQASVETIEENENTYIFIDSCGREVELPNNLTRIAPSGLVAQLILFTQCPETLVGWAKTPDESFLNYMDEKYAELPVFGQFYGKNANFNMEEVIKANPQVIIDLGDKKASVKEDMDKLQEKTGIPTLFIEANVNTFAEAYRTLGKITGTEEHAEKAAKYIEETLEVATNNKKNIVKKVSVMFGTGQDGLACNADGSFHAEVLDIVGVDNAVKVDNLSGKGGGNIINLEQLIIFNPDIIIQQDSIKMKDNMSWQVLDAVKNNKIYKIPSVPQSWLANPPSVNKILGVWWLGKIAYPELYKDYDIVEKAIEYYSIFWHHETTKEEMEKIIYSN